MRQRTIGVLIALSMLLAVGRADAKPWAVDVPGDWFPFTLPVIKSQAAKLRGMNGVKEFEILSYSAGAGAVLFIMAGVVDPGSSGLSYDGIVDFDRRWRERELANTNFRQVSYSSDLVDGQMVTHSEDSFPEGGFRNLRLIGVDGTGLVHVLHVGCFSPNGAFELCARVQQSARLTPPDATPLGNNTRNVVVGIAIFGVLVLVYFAMRKRDTSVPMRRADPLPAARVHSSPSSAPDQPGPDHGYVPNRPSRSSRMPSSIPLDEPDVVGGAVRSQVETAGRGTKISYAAAVLTLSQPGIVASREDGVRVDVAWNDLVGIVTRRFPTTAPYDGATFVDLISAPGETLRLVPWTQIAGIDIFGSVEERARSFARLVAKRCPQAKLDAASRTFVDGTDPAPQLPDTETLAEHDRRLA